jgi:tetratricopeptide (TPR) repeat protein
MVNYYEILDIQTDSSQEEIKKSFRKKVMKQHPDRNPDDRKRAEETVRVLIEAYQVLSDPERRLVHDRRLNIDHTEEANETIWDELRRRTYDPAARTRLMMHELLEGNSRRGAEIYEALMRDYVNFDLLPYLDLKDYLDCKFLLAEEFERQGRLELALEMYTEVYKEEAEMPRLCCFFDDLKIRLKNIYTRDLPREKKPDVAIEYLMEAVEFGFDRPDTALIYKRIAECYVKLDKLGEARAALEQAFKIYPKLKSVRRICDKLGMSPAR